MTMHRNHIRAATVNVYLGAGVRIDAVSVSRRAASPGVVWR